jgi:hypothetical protein
MSQHLKIHKGCQSKGKIIQVQLKIFIKIFESSTGWIPTGHSLICQVFVSRVFVLVSRGHPGHCNNVHEHESGKKKETDCLKWIFTIMIQLFGEAQKLAKRCLGQVFNFKLWCIVARVESRPNYCLNAYQLMYLPVLKNCPVTIGHKKRKIAMNAGR